MGVEAEAPRGMETPAAEGGAGGGSGSSIPGRPNIPGPKPPRPGEQPGGAVPDPYNTAPPSQPNQAPRGNQQPRQNAPEPAAAPAMQSNGEVEKLLAQLLTAINEQGGANSGLLTKAVEQLGQIAQNGKTPSARVPV